MPFVEEAFLADLALLFFFLLGVLSGAPLEGGLLASGEDGLGLPSRLVDEVARTRIGLTITDCDLPLMIDEALEDEGLLLSPEVEADLVGVFEVVVVGISFRPRIGLLVGTSVAEFFLGNFETGR